jgi:hypothetical protein
MLLWRVYYDDGATYSNLDGPVEAAPALGVQCIVKRDAAPALESVGRVVMEGFDHYWWSGSEWWGADAFGLWDYLQRPGWKRVLFGRTLSTSDFVAIRRRALSDPGFPPYSGGG